MGYVIKNAAPQNINLGAVDKSLKPQPPKPIIVPTHVNLGFIYAAGGPTTKEFVDGGRIVALYGRETFDRTGPYFNHGARMVEIISGAGNPLMVVRIVPDDNDTIANVTLYADIIQDTVNVYQRTADGAYALDENGDPIVDTTVTGYRIKIISEVNNDDILTPYGIKTSKPGYMTDSDGNVSTMYPILELRAKYKGSKYNNYGITINTPTADDVSVTIMEGSVALPYELGIVKRDSVNSTGTFINNLNGVPFEQFVFDKNGVDGLTGAKVDLITKISKWYNTTNPLKDLVYPVIDTPYIYENNLQTILDNLLVAEKEYFNANVTINDGSTRNTSQWLDFLQDVPIEEQSKILNLFTARSTKNVPAFTFEIDSSVVTLADNHKEVYFSKATPIYLGGGKDGTLSRANFENGVKRFMEKYLDKNSEVMDPAINIENVLYDPGFELDTKESLINFISVRKNTFVGLGTHIHTDDNSYKTLDEERAIGVTLKAALGLAPESTFFNTPVTRGIIVVGSGIDSLDPAGKRYTLVMDIARKCARMMGGTKWNRNLLFDSGGKNIITQYSDIQPSFVPGGIIADLWNIGLIWPEKYDRETSYFPAMQSVYDNDTSVMNNIFAAIALTVTNNLASAVFREFTGTTSMTTVEFIAAVESSMNDKLKDVFDGVINASAKVIITDFDEAKGFSWTLVSKLSGNVMKTVQTHYIEMYNNDSV